MSFTEKVVLITGASSGIGAATAIEFAKEGAKIAIVGRNVEKLQKVASQCEEAGSKPLVIVADISNDDETKKLVQKVIDEFNRLDVLVNNAGFSRDGSLLEGNILQGYDATMKTNVRAAVHLTSLSVPHLIKTKGNIVNVSSIAATTLPNWHTAATPYHISKAALNHFSRCAAIELAKHGVRVNILSPGPTKTDFLENSGISNIKFDDSADHIPLKRVSESKEMADLILFLAGDKAIGITGSDLVADNGCLLKP